MFVAIAQTAPPAKLHIPWQVLHLALFDNEGGMRNVKRRKAEQMGEINDFLQK
jgi:hypothetical protein